MSKLFKRVTNEKKYLKDFNLEEARGFVVNELIFIESILDLLIKEYFKPKNEENFGKIVLNSSIIGFVGKAKVLRGLDIIDIKLYNDLTNLSAIRNSFAHAQVNTFHHIHHVLKGDEGSDLDFDSYQNMDKMNSQGKVTQKNPRDYLKEFNNKAAEITGKLMLMYEQTQTI